MRHYIASSLIVLSLVACGQKEEAPAATSAPQAAPAAPAPAAQVVAANPGGEKLYKATCAMCHAAGTAGAPIPGNKEEWAPRSAQGNDVLYKHAIEGFTGQKGAMPPKGGNTAASDEDVKAAVDYMLAKQK